jgi:hypothetical protein
MNFDLLDTAFLQRAASPAVPATGVALPAAPATPAGVVAEANRSDSVVVADGVLARLLDSCPDQWWALADRLAAAWQSGSRSIAVAGHAPREGRSTLIHGLELILPVLGCPVRSYESSAEWWQELVGDAERWQWHREQADRQHELVLVDAGIWFPPGRLRLHPLRLASFGFDAVIVARRQETAPCPASMKALAEIGVSLLGEVVSFAPAAAVRAA